MAEGRHIVASMCDTCVRVGASVCVCVYLCARVYAGVHIKVINGLKHP